MAYFSPWSKCGAKYHAAAPDHLSGKDRSGAPGRTAFPFFRIQAIRRVYFHGPHGVGSPVGWAPPATNAALYAFRLLYFRLFFSPWIFPPGNAPLRAHSQASPALYTIPLTNLHSFPLLLTPFSRQIHLLFRLQNSFTFLIDPKEEKVTFSHRETGGQTPPNVQFRYRTGKPGGGSCVKCSILPQGFPGRGSGAFCKTPAHNIPSLPPQRKRGALIPTGSIPPARIGTGHCRPIHCAAHSGKPSWMRLHAEPSGNIPSLPAGNNINNVLSPTMGCA